MTARTRITLTVFDEFEGCLRRRCARVVRAMAIRPVDGTKRAGAEHRATSLPAVFALLPDSSAFRVDRVHVVHDPYAPCPLALCRIHVLPDLYLAWFVQDALLCRACLAELPHDAILRPAVGERRLLGKTSPTLSRLTGCRRWWLSLRADRLIRRAMAAEGARHG